MTDLKRLVQQADIAVSSVPLPPGGIEPLMRRRERKRRAQRIVAGSVGIAIFVATLWLLTSGSLGVGTQTVPAGQATNAQGRVVRWQGFIGLPPEGAPQTSASGGALVASSDLGCGMFPEGSCPAPVAQGARIYVYADGRVISVTHGKARVLKPIGYREQLLSPQGVEMIRSGALRPKDLICQTSRGAAYACAPPVRDVPEGAWADATARWYVPPGYALCLSHRDGLGMSAIVDQLPSAAADLLGNERMFTLPDADPARCFDVTIEDARLVDEVLSEAGFFWRTDGATYTRVSLRVAPAPRPGEVIWVSFYPLLPDGTPA